MTPLLTLSFPPNAIYPLKLAKLQANLFLSPAYPITDGQRTVPVSQARLDYVLLPTAAATVRLLTDPHSLTSDSRTRRRLLENGAMLQHLVEEHGHRYSLMLKPPLHLVGLGSAVVPILTAQANASGALTLLVAVASAAAQALVPVLPGTVNDI